MELEELILPHCSSGSGVGHPMQKLTCSFSGTGDMTKEQGKLLLLSVKKLNPNLDTGRLCALSSSEFTGLTDPILLLFLKAISAFGQLAVADIALWRGVIGTSIRVG